MLRSSVEMLQRAVAEKSLALAHHLDNVGRLAGAVARELGLSEHQIRLTRLTGELHDVGKAALPDSILNKPGPLDDAEWAFMKRHTIIGEQIVAAAPALARVAPLVRSAHERDDGCGYPDGLRRNEIPLSSRIVAVADAYDAMTSPRPYSLQRTPEQALDELRRCAGTQFDRVVIEAFIAVCPREGRAREPASTLEPERTSRRSSRSAAPPGQPANDCGWSSSASSG